MDDDRKDARPHERRHRPGRDRADTRLTLIRTATPFLPVKKGMKSSSAWNTLLVANVHWFLTRECALCFPKMLAPHKIIEDVRQRGFAFIEEFWPQSSTREVADAFGKVFSVPGIGDLQTLRPKRRDQSSPNLYSGNFGMDPFPLHTDLAHWYLPPRFLMLRCIQGAASVATVVVHRHPLLRGLPPTTTSRALFVPRRPVTGRLTLLRFLQRVGEDYLLRWDQLFLKPANEEAAEVAFFISHCKISSIAHIILENPGDTLILDNWRALHGRTKVPDCALSRVIERVYLNSLTR